MLNCEKFRIALLLVLIVVTDPFCETAAVPPATPLSWTAAPAVGGRRGSDRRGMAHRTILRAARRAFDPAGGCNCSLD